MNEKLLKPQTEFKKNSKIILPKYTLIEEILNSVTHGIGAILAIAAIIILILASSFQVKSIVCVSVYSVTLFMLYIVSTLYHSLKIEKAKKVFRVLDHCSIFLLIAGTYTPICLLMLNNLYGTILFVVVWLIAVLGIILNSIDLKKFAKFSMVCYILMGWAVIFAAKPMLEVITKNQLAFLFWGGIAYTVGAVIYGIGKKIKYMHSVWHLFVLFGSVLHFFMILDFIKLEA